MAQPRRSPLDSILDVVVYAPIGAFFHGPEVVGELAERGRTQVNNARVVGKLAVHKGRAEVERLGSAAQHHLTDALVAAARAAGAPLAGAERPEPTAHDDGSVVDADASDAAAPGPSLRVVPESVPTHADLPIPDYDNLSASQVVPRLDDLADDELAAVRDYEQAHRGRMTILSRIAQLQAS
jgi:hypothetical protein